MKKTKDFLTKNKKLVIIVSAIIIIIFYFYFRSSSTSTTNKYFIGSVKSGNIVMSVSGSGQVEANERIDLKSSNGSGTITDVKVKAGDMVKAGQTLIVIDEAKSLVSLIQARSNLETATANYNKVVNGATPDDLLTYEASLSNSEKSLDTSMRDAYYKIEDSIFSKIDNLFNNGQTVNPEIKVRVENDSVAKAANYSRLAITEKIKGIKDVLYEVPFTESSRTKIKELIISAKSLSDQLGKIVGDLSGTNSALSASQIDTYYSYVNSAASQINGALSTVNSAEASYTSAKNELYLKKAPAKSEELISAKASLTNAQASLMSAQNAYNDNVIKAPFDGQVASLNAVKGNQVDSSTALATVISPEKNAKISLNEIDVAKIKVGDKSKLTFDAFPDLSLDGEVIDVDNIGTVVSGVVSYNVKIRISDPDSRIKVGMSVSATIINGQKENVLIVPTSAIKTLSTNKNQSYVEVLPEGLQTTGTSTSITTNLLPTKKNVVTGLSNDIQTEIVSGLTEGEKIIIRTINAVSTTGAVSTGQTRSATSLFSGGARATGTTGR